MDAIPSERGTTFRYPSTANLYVDSLDRVNPNDSSANFLINRPNNILSGFFTRLALNEIVLDYGVPNVRAVDSNNTFSVLIGSTPQNITLSDGFYTAKEALDRIVALLNIAVGSATFSITTDADGDVFLTNTSNYTIVETNLSVQLNITGSATASLSKLVESPVLLPTKYIDIVCDNLTYCQDLKDTSTNATARDVLYRWYFAWDNECSYDAYGFPILQGYRQFIQRRYLSFPKQIKWDNNQPIGQLSFQIYDNSGDLYNTTNGELEYNMSLLVSEV